MMNMLRLIVCAALCFGRFGIHSLPATPQQFTRDPEPAATGVRADAGAQMDALLQSFIDEGKTNALAAFVAKGGRVVYHKAFGWRDPEARAPASVDDYYVLFSQTKAVTTVAFMSLVEDGLVSIDDPVAKCFPGIPDRVVTQVNADGTYETRPAKSPMTFVHLMTHTSGLGAGKVREIRRARRHADEAPAGFGGAGPARVPAGQHTGGGNPDARYLEEEMLALAQLPLGFAPGTRWDYHISTNMLAYLIERISGRSLREYVKEKVLEPLGMNDTDWYYPADRLSRFVRPHRVVEGKLQPGPTLYGEGAVSEQQTYAEGAIGLNGPIEDYAKFCQMLLNKGEFNGRRILKPETVELMTSINRLPPDGGAERGFQFGLGFELHREKKPVPAVSDSAFAWGGMLGTGYLVDPEKELVALFYVNMYGADPAMYPKFVDKAYALFAAPAEIVIEDGGTGPHPAIVTEDPALPGITIYRPRDLAVFGDGRKLPVLLWGNGACADTTAEHKNFLNELASHGYLVLALGRLDRLLGAAAPAGARTSPDQLIAALDWILARNADAGAAFFGKIDGERVAAMGMSCGGLQALQVSFDPRITTTVVCNSGVLPAPSPWGGMPSLRKEDLKKLHAPVLYIIGGPSDIAYANAMDDFERVDHVPFALASLDVGHGGTYGRPRGGEFTRVALAWLDWRLKGNASGSGIFFGQTEGARLDPKWIFDAKNFPAR